MNFWDENEIPEDLKRYFQPAPQLGLEERHDCLGWATGSPCGECYVCHMVQVFREVRRVLRDDGTLWLNLGDSYAGSRGNYGGGDRGAGKQRLIKHGSSAQNPVWDGLEGWRPPASHKQDGLKPKDLCGIPWRVAFALQANGWWLRDGIIWAKPNGMPGSQEDRCTSSYEMVFLLSKSQRYWSDFDAIKTPPRESSLVRTAQDIQAQAGSHRANGGAEGKPMKAAGVRRSDKQRGHSRLHAGFNDRWDAMPKEEQQSMPATMRNVWFVPPAQCKDAHFAVMPPEVARRCILAGCPTGGAVLDPFLGSGTTAEVARKMGCKCIGTELNADYVKLARKRLRQGALPLTG